MACFSPTIAVKRASSSADEEFGGCSGDIHHASSVTADGTLTIARRTRWISYLIARGGGAREPVVDRLAEARVRHRHHRDGGRACGIERAQMGEQVGGGLDEIAARRQVEHRRGAFGARAPGRAEGQQRLARFDLLGVEPQPRARRVMGGELPGAIGGPVGMRRRPRLTGGGCAERDRGARSPRAAARPAAAASAASRQATMVDSRPIGVGPAVDDQLDAAAQVGEHVLRGRGRHVAGAVRRRRHDRAAEGGENVARDRMARHAHRDGVEAGGRELADRAIGALGQHQGQRPRPERRREPLARRGRSARARARRQRRPRGRSAD